MKPLTDSQVIQIAKASQRSRWGVVLFLMGVLVGMTASKFSARLAYQAGLNEGTASVKESSLLLDRHREKVCLQWWFADSKEQLVSAKNWMCKRGDL